MERRRDGEGEKKELEIMELELQGIGAELESTYKFERQNFRTDRRIAPKFGTHVPIDTLTIIG